MSKEKQNGGLKPDKIRVPHLQKMKAEGEPIAMVTGYDHVTACLADSAGMEIILVGDSLGNVLLGLETTVGVNIEQMIHHSAAAASGIHRAMVLADMPFLSYQVSPDQAVENAGRLVAEGGAEAVKLEGAGEASLAAVRRIVDAGIPVMGHIGLQPQAIHAQGGYRIQGRRDDVRERLKQEAFALQEAGAFTVLLELVVADLAEEISRELDVPTIGIGAGAGCDGQVLVWHDLLGLRGDKPPKFVREYANLWQSALDGLTQYRDDVKSRAFPDIEKGEAHTGPAKNGNGSRETKGYLTPGEGN